MPEEKKINTVSVTKTNSQLTLIKKNCELLMTEIYSAGDAS